MSVELGTIGVAKAIATVSALLIGAHSVVSYLNPQGHLSDKTKADIATAAYSVSVGDGRQEDKRSKKLSYDEQSALDEKYPSGSRRACDRLFQIIEDILQEIDEQAKINHWSDEKKESLKIDAVAQWADKCRSAYYSARKEMYGDDYSCGIAWKDFTTYYDPEKPGSYLEQVHPEYAENPHRIYYSCDHPFGIEMTEPNGSIVRFMAW